MSGWCGVRETRKSQVDGVGDFTLRKVPRSPIAGHSTSLAKNPPQRKLGVHSDDDSSHFEHDF